MRSEWTGNKTGKGRRTVLLASLLLLLCLMQMQVFAGTVKPSGKKNNTDRTRIMNELKKTGSVTLVKNGKYYLKSTLYVQSGWTINANGATITCKAGAVRNKASATGYSSLKNFTINGGTWVYTNSTGYKSSSFQFIHASNVTLSGMTIKCANYKAHSIELIACRNCTIKNCKITAQGSCPSTCLEEMIQIDVAAPRTAPVLKGTSFLNGAACENIYILNNTVTGARAVCANYAKKDGGQYLNSFHRNIVVRNNTLTGKSSEALALFNVGGATVSGNTIITKSARTTTAYSIGCHAAIFGTAPSWMRSSRLYITGNTIKGGRQAVQVYSHTASKFGYVTVTGNKLYCRKGTENALKAIKGQAVSLSTGGNKAYKWNGK